MVFAFHRYYHKSLDGVEDTKVVSVETFPVDKPLDKNILSSRDCYTLDCKDELYCWNGKKSSPLQRQTALHAVNQLLTHDVIPPPHLVAKKSIANVPSSKKKTPSGAAKKQAVSSVKPKSEFARAAWVTVTKVGNIIEYSC